MSASAPVDVSPRPALPTRTCCPGRRPRRRPGVAPEDRSRVFEPFWRGRVAVAQAIRGTGIGLALVTEYVTAMGGTAGVESSPKGGATFWFTVPASPAGVGGGREPATTLEAAHTDPEDG